jgi:hypothetical protein
MRGNKHGLVVFLVLLAVVLFIWQFPTLVKELSKYADVQPVHAEQRIPTQTPVVGGPSLSASFVNDVLQQHHSPAFRTGQSLYDLSVHYHVDDAYALSVFWVESHDGTQGIASRTKSLGNIRCAGFASCSAGYRSYVTWEAGFEDFYTLIATVYVPRGLTTVETITPVYAPSTENDVSAYVQNVRQCMTVLTSGHVV